MEYPRQIIVNAHIDGLRREAEAMRIERRVRQWTRDGYMASTAPEAEHHPARVRLGHLLIGIGRAVSGSAGEPQSGAAERTA